MAISHAPVCCQRMDFILGIYHILLNGKANFGVSTSIKIDV